MLRRNGIFPARDTHDAPRIPDMEARRNGETSFWWRQAGGVPHPTAPLAHDVDLDIAIVGAGYTGLWTAYYLAHADPSLRIGIVEAEFVGFGASGRNGGWLAGEFTWSRARYAAAAGREAVLAMQQALWASVDEVIAVADREGIDADIVKAGELRVALTPAQLTRLRHLRADEHAWGVTDADSQWLDADAVLERVNIEGALGGDWSPHAARIQPAKLVRGLASCVRDLGVDIWEDTPAISVAPHRIQTPHADVSAAVVVRATEGYSGSLPDHRRDVLSMNSSMIVTEPLTAQQRRSIGWDGGELLSDVAHGYFYAQHTADGRIAIGGRGVPYRFASRFDRAGRTPRRTVEDLRALLAQCFPALRDVPIDHAWSGVLGVPRDWCASVGFDPRRGMAWAGGYAGIGVATSNLAARSLTQQITGAPSTEPLAWTNWPIRAWEPEPLRWIGVRTAYALYRAADARESGRRDGRTSSWASIAERLTGRD